MSKSRGTRCQGASSGLLTEPVTRSARVAAAPIRYLLGRAHLLPKGGIPRPTRVSAFVTVSWAWTNQSQGNISWTFVNSDPNNSHAVVLFRNNYIFGGAFWPVYLGPDDTVSHMLDRSSRSRH